MVVKVLVVDDSSFFRRRVSEIINNSPALEVIGTANNGLEAIEMVTKLKPDVVTMDIEMPVMDGITAVKKIMASHPVPILMFSSLTHQGATATLDALEAGAADFLPKKFEDIARNKEDAIALLQQRIKAISTRRVSRFARPSSTAKAIPKTTRTPSPALSSLKSLNSTNRQILSTTEIKKPLTDNSKKTLQTPHRQAPFKASGKSYDILAIGTSTGGPVALQTILSALPADFKLPIVLIQHMPGTFTKAFADRLNGICKIKVKEACDGDKLFPGCAYLAPGGKQMMLDGRSGNATIRIHEGSDKLNYRPSVDITFASLSKVYGGNVLAVVLTGMGADGREGARMLKEKGANIWAQDEDTCVVYGMPQAVFKAGYVSHSLPLNNFAKCLDVEIQHE